MITMVSNVWSRRRGNGLRNTVTIGENKTRYNIVVCFRNSYMIHSEQHISDDRHISNLIYETWYLWKKTISTEVEYIDTDGTCYQGESCVIQSEVPGITGEHPCTIESCPKSCLQFATPYGLPVICFYPWRNDGKEMFSTWLALCNGNPPIKLHFTCTSRESISTKNQNWYIRVEKYSLKIPFPNIFSFQPKSFFLNKSSFIPDRSN